MSINGQIWCGDCREWYLEEYKECPDCRHMEPVKHESSKLERQATEINNLYDRLQAAHEERDRHKKALEEIMDYGTTGEDAKLMYMAAKEALK